jgi:hypothetical protein
MYTNPIHQENGKWYFWDDTWDRQGPFDREDEALDALRRYIESTPP